LVVKGNVPNAEGFIVFFEDVLYFEDGVKGFAIEERGGDFGPDVVGGYWDGRDPLLIHFCGDDFCEQGKVHCADVHLREVEIEQAFAVEGRLDDDGYDEFGLSECDGANDGDTIGGEKGLRCGNGGIVGEEQR
jgi:hypothetical protein